MSLTISNVEHTLGNKLDVLADIAFDTSYAIGGESVTANNVGLSTIERLIIEPCQGYTFEWDKTNAKIKVFQQAPAIVHEEVVTVTSKVGYLKWPAAHIEYVTDDATPYRVIPGGLTATTGQVAVDMGFSLTTGVLTKGQRCSLIFYDTVDGGTVKVSYITQAWKEVADNMVQACMTSGARTYGHADLAFTAGTPDIVTIGEDLIACQCVCWNNGGTLTPMASVKDGGTIAGGATECIIDFTDGLISFEPATDTVDTTGDVVYVTYIRDPGAGYFIHDRWDYTEIADA